MKQHIKLVEVVAEDNTEYHAVIQLDTYALDELRNSLSGTILNDKHSPKHVLDKLTTLLQQLGQAYGEAELSFKKKYPRQDD